MSANVDFRLDVSGVCCPVPLIELGKAVKLLKPGQRLEVTGNDPIFESSIRDFCEANGHTLLDVKTGDSRRVCMLIELGG